MPHTRVVGWSAHKTAAALKISESKVRVDVPLDIKRPGKKLRNESQRWMTLINVLANGDVLLQPVLVIHIELSRFGLSLLVVILLMTTSLHVSGDFLQLLSLAAF